MELPCYAAVLQRREFRNFLILGTNATRHGSLHGYLGQLRVGRHPHFLRRGRRRFRRVPNLLFVGREGVHPVQRDVDRLPGSVVQREVGGWGGCRLGIGLHHVWWAVAMVVAGGALLLLLLPRWFTGRYGLGATLRETLAVPGAFLWLPARGYGPVGLVLVLRVRFALAGAGRGLLEIWPESGVSRVDSYT